MSRPKSAIELWLERQQEQAQGEAMPIPGEFVGTPKNFLPVEQRRSFTVPAGTSAYSAPDPFPGRLTAEDQRQSRAQLAREVEARSRLSGSSTVRSPRADAQRGWHPIVERDRVGRLFTRWERDAPEDDASE